MIKKTLLGVAISLAIACPSVANAQGKGWTASFSQGILEHIVRNEPGTEFNISCDTRATDDASRTGLFVLIKNQSPPMDSKIRVIVDKKDFIFFVTDEGIQIDSHAASGNFYAMWEALRKGKSMRVAFANGLSSTFSLANARKALGSKVCDHGFTGRF